MILGAAVQELKGTKWRGGRGRRCCKTTAKRIMNVGCRNTHCALSHNCTPTVVHYC